MEEIEERNRSEQSKLCGDFVKLLSSMMPALEEASIDYDFSGLNELFDYTASVFGWVPFRTKEKLEASKAAAEEHQRNLVSLSCLRIDLPECGAKGILVNGQSSVWRKLRTQATPTFLAILQKNF